MIITKDYQECQRPLVFIGHSLGGLVIKQVGVILALIFLLLSFP